MDPDVSFEPEDLDAIDDVVIKERLNDLLSTNYRPAKDEGEAESMRTTEQLYDMVQKHAPLAVPLERFRKAMLDLGYQESCIEDRFVWLLKAV